MKKILVFMAASLLIAIPAFAKELKLEKKAGDNTVTLTLEKNPPITGDNKAVIEIKDSAGKIVKNAQVELNASMPAMPGMPAMKNTSKVQAGAEAYETMINFSMPGSWNIELKLNINNQKQVVKYNVDVK
ncbi:FixH family protein [Desulforegula conservatrix]|uniref:FixH family protein n=1 Tax=Desulforegula conservatrix TaxID=153026 RepID=UPI000416FF30|nr:FixH family protein [Desulforegula conservatrix]